MKEISVMRLFDSDELRFLEAMEGHRISELI